MIGIIGGIFGGLSGSLFIWLLNYAQTLREMHPNLIFILPLAGVIIAVLKGAPKLILGSFLTHVGGGSAGREGAVIALTRVFSESVSPWLKLNDRKLHQLIVVSTGAGFGAAFGAPIAGFFFGFEYRRSALILRSALTWFHCLVAAIIAQAIMRFTHVTHFRLPEFSIPQYTLQNLVFTLILGILLGFASIGFHHLRHRFEKFFQPVPHMMTGFIGGSILLLLFYFFGLHDFQGLGKEMISRSATEVVPLIVPIKKALLSTLTLGTGFQGGEFFPLAFIGSTLGSAFSFVDPNLTALFAALGYVAIYGAATRTSFACMILACELFGWKIGLFAFVALGITDRINSRRT